MKKYLIDTNIAIFYMKGKHNLDKQFDTLSAEDCYISEITLAELKFGVAKSDSPDKNRKALNNFLTGVQVLPIFHSLDLFADEKARLQRAGTPIDDFDLLIGVTSVTHNLVMVTNNTKHFKQIKNIELEDWVNG
ncbi:DNA-binding protein [Flavobacterium akiainvivens]|uniref:Ribonuclease VapC n=1 Tax=Flavobacterium akiainvivens TaxID=1202724 RepID=A0A0M8MAP6_9FLAO|nr:type II toxin-antitoxin system VapC family toxin [Flavobacterium akiainvivens]KOS07143.1 DNA-binding protein [Flavobacterium akiainvivens]SFQ73237.1 tRNA(fMet)-specific endonuclease VapC [Flavobacterium akiainvivens]